MENDNIFLPHSSVHIYIFSSQSVVHSFCRFRVLPLPSRVNRKLLRGGEDVVTLFISYEIERTRMRDIKRFFSPARYNVLVIFLLATSETKSNLTKFTATRTTIRQTFNEGKSYSWNAVKIVQQTEQDSSELFHSSDASSFYTRRNGWLKTGKFVVAQTFLWIKWAEKNTEKNANKNFPALRSPTSVHVKILHYILPPKQQTTVESCWTLNLGTLRCLINFRCFF